MSAIYINRDETQYGPFNEEQIYAMITDRKVVGTDLIWREGMATWQAASEVLTPFSAPAVAKPPPLPRVGPLPVQSAMLQSPNVQSSPASNRAVAMPLHGGQDALGESRAAAVSIFERLSQPAPAPAAAPAPVRLPSQSLPPTAKPVYVDSATPPYSLPPAAPVTATDTREVPRGEVDFDGKKPLSKSWQRKFAIYDNAGGREGQVNMNKLTLKEQNAVAFNSFALIFGIAYYVFKGMWRKGISLFVLGLLLTEIVLLLIPDSAPQNLIKIIEYGAITLPIFALRANIDYYKKVRLGNKSWW